MTISQFFDYYFQNPPGDGPFGLRHLIFMGILLTLSVAGYQYFKRRPKQARTVVVVLSVLVFTARMIRQIHRVTSGIETNPAVALPWHLCSVMILLMPVVAAFNIKKLKQWVYPLCWIGGIVTIGVGTYFSGAYFTVFEVEALIAHAMLILIPVIEMSIGEFRLDIRNSWKTAVGLAVMTLWALFADLVLFLPYHTNSSNLMENELGFSVPGIPFQALYVMIAVVFIAVMHGIPTLYRMAAHRRLLKAQTAGEST